MKPLLKARNELEKAGAAIEDMRNAKDSKSYTEAWELFLIRLERVWNKICSQLSKSPKYKTCLVIDQAKQLRKDDPLLTYLTTARGANEHTIEDITENEPGRIGINPAIGNELSIDMHIRNGNVFIKSEQPLKIDFIPGKVTLKPVTNRAGTCEPPKIHLGNTLPKIDPVFIAEAGLKYYANLIQEAEDFFVNLMTFGYVRSSP
jgi:hypothetical protein